MRELEAHLRGVLDLPEADMVVEQLTGGNSNLTYRVSFGDVHLVVRRPPDGPLAAGSHDMHREYRVLSRLYDAYPRAPRAFHYCEDESVFGAPFVVIEHREGVVVRRTIPDELAGHEDAAMRIDGAFIDAMADLHTVAPDAIGLGDLGRPADFARRQVDGWRKRWHRAGGESLPVMDEIAERLLGKVPDPPATSIVHNDLKLDNCQFDPGDPDTVTSVFDWDMATLGDPLFDVALALVSMQAEQAWVLTDDEAIERYASRSHIDVDAIDWYLAFAAWRTAVVLQQLIHHYAEDDPRRVSFANAIPGCAERASELLP